MDRPRGAALAGETRLASAGLPLPGPTPPTPARSASEGSVREDPRWRFGLVLDLRWRPRHTSPKRERGFRPRRSSLALRAGVGVPMATAQQQPEAPRPGLAASVPDPEPLAP